MSSTFGTSSLAVALFLTLALPGGAQTLTTSTS